MAGKYPEGITDEDRNGKTALDFYIYCRRNPQLRFWQALRNWSGHAFVFVSDKQKPTYENWSQSSDGFPVLDENGELFLSELKDTFSVEGKDGKVAK